MTSLSGGVVELEQTHTLVGTVVSFRSLAGEFSALAVSYRQRALALFPVIPSPARESHHCCFSDGMEVDTAPVVAGQFEDAEVDH